ncbi:protein of unknown function [Pararobbsia alpina]
MLIKIHDADEKVPARFTAHTALDDPNSPSHARPRRSIELRALLFFRPRRPTI